MALTKQEKQQVTEEVRQLFDNSKLSVIASYQGTTVKAMQALRRQARDSQTIIRVAKNRLVIKALGQSAKFKDIPTGGLTGQLLYAFNSDDEVAPAQTLAQFARTNPNIIFVGAITADGQLLGSDDVTVLANLPSKQQLRSQLAGTLMAPMSGFASVLSGNVRSVLNILQARADAIQ